MLTLGLPAAKGIGLRVKIEILVTSFDLSIASRTAEPTRPVAPVRMRCMILQEGKNVGRQRESWIRIKGKSSGGQFGH